MLAVLHGVNARPRSSLIGEVGLRLFRRERAVRCHEQKDIQVSRAVHCAAALSFASVACLADHIETAVLIVGMTGVAVAASCLAELVIRDRET